jgi:hypothetical protein
MEDKQGGKKANVSGILFVLLLIAAFVLLALLIYLAWRSENPIPQKTAARVFCRVLRPYQLHGMNSQS